MFDFKLILILVLSIVIYILYNKIDKINVEVDKIKIAMSKDKKKPNKEEKSKEENKQRYLEHFYDNNSESAVNNISNIDETTEILNETHQNNINNESIKQCFKHEKDNDVSESSISIDFNLSTHEETTVAEYSNEDKSKTHDNEPEDKIDINIDGIISDQAPLQVSGYFQSIANAKPNDDLLEPIEYDLEETVEKKSKLENTEKTFDLQEIVIENNNKKTFDLQEIVIETNDENINEIQNEVKEDNHMIDSDSESEQSYDQTSKNDELLMDAEDDVLVKVSSDKEDSDTKDEKNELMKSLKELISKSSFNKHKLDKLQNYAKELNINIEKDINGKTKNKTRSELWKEISQNIK